MITIQNRSGGGAGYLVPAGGEVLWYGTASNLPEEWQIDSYANHVFVKAANTGNATNAVLGSAIHSHTVPDTSTRANHRHSTSSGNLGSNSGTTDFSPTSNEQNAKHTHGHTGQSGYSSYAGAHAHTTSNTDSSIIYPPFRKLYWIKALEETSIPIGGIVMWDDVIANIAEEFGICNGNNSTPDLRSKFIYGAVIDSDVGVAGGSETHTHTNPNAATAGAHTHTIYASVGGPTDTERAASGYAEGVSISNSSHSHSGTGTSNTDSAHNHTIGSTGSANHLPQYIKLYFIMRVV